MCINPSVGTWLSSLPQNYLGLSFKLKIIYIALDTRALTSETYRVPPCAHLPYGEPHSPPWTAQEEGIFALSGYRNGDLGLLENVMASERSEERCVVEHLSPPLEEVSHMLLIQRRDV